MLSFGQKVGLSAASGALLLGGGAAAAGEAWFFSPEALQARAHEAHQTVQDDTNKLTNLESNLPAECVRVLRAAATAQAVDPRFNYMQAVRSAQPSVCGVGTEEIAAKYWIAQHNVAVDQQIAENADGMAQPGSALPIKIAVIATFAAVGAAFGPMVASGALGNNVPSRQPAWQ